jgi:hypothetical protein
MAGLDGQGRLLKDGHVQNVGYGGLAQLRVREGSREKHGNG